MALSRAIEISRACATGVRLGTARESGISPFNCGVIERSIAFVFADAYGNNVGGICEAIAHEAGHSFGLEHEFLCEDPMTYLYGCGNKSFQETDEWCGTDAAETRECGTQKQNTVEILYDHLGAAEVAECGPTVPCEEGYDCIDGTCVPNSDGNDQTGGANETSPLTGGCGTARSGRRSGSSTLLLALAVLATASLRRRRARAR